MAKDTKYDAYGIWSLEPNILITIKDDKTDTPIAV